MEQVALKRRVVLVGAGNAHLQVVRGFGMNPYADTELVLVNEEAEIPYSAMVPGFVAGDYTWPEISFDLVTLCTSRGVRWLQAKFHRLDPVARQIHFDGDRPPLEFDVISFNTGSSPQPPMSLADKPAFFCTKSLGSVVRKIQWLTDQWSIAETPRTFAVVGGGPGGLELALAIRKKWRQMPWLNVKVFEAGPSLLPGGSRRLHELFANALNIAKIELFLNAKVVGGSDQHLLLENGDRQTVDGALFATKAAPLPEMAGLAVLDGGDGGFFRVNRFLQSPSHPFIFGAGDAVSFPRLLPKAGVYAVRQGPVLFGNLGRFLEGKRLIPYRPQRRFLTIFNTADGCAILHYSAIVSHGVWARRLKSWIDRRWVESFSPPPIVADAEEMFCGGCAAKVDAQSLGEVVASLGKSQNKNVLFGTEAFEDAAIVAKESLATHSAGGVLGVSVDFFRSFMNDPFLVGEIAAINALNDLWAKNIVPRFALSMIGLPEVFSVSMQKRYFSELLIGAKSFLDAHGVALVGGHTTQLKDITVGFSVWGDGHRDQLWLKRSLKPGDSIWLTKALGTGVLLAALHQGRCRAPWLSALVTSMRQSQGELLEFLQEFGVTACTDVSGFGLARHLLEMAGQSGCGVHLDLASIPVLPGAQECLAAGLRSQIHAANRAAVGEGLKPGSASEMPCEILYDPQTSGGLLIGLDSERDPGFLDGLRRLGFFEARKTGEVVADSKCRLHLG